MEAKDKENAEKKGITEIARSIQNAIRVDSVKDDYVCLGYKISFDNGVEMRIIEGDESKPATVCIFNSGDKERYELFLSDYEYKLLTKEASKKIRLQLQEASEKKLACIMNLLKEGQNIR